MNSLMRALLIAVAIILAVCSCSRTPQQQLMSAALDGDVTKVEALLDNPKVDVNWRAPQSGANALETAAAHDRLAVVELLLRQGADPNITSIEGFSPLQAAAYHGYTDVAIRLVQAGADVNAAETRYGYTPLATAASKGHVDIIRLLLDAGAHRQTRIKDGRSPLDLAVEHGHRNAANILSVYQPAALR